MDGEFQVEDEMSKRSVDSGVGAVESGEGREWRWVQVGRGGLPPSVAREEGGVATVGASQFLPPASLPPTDRGSTQQSVSTSKT